jgi:tetratricopeptide (TPR) repeat protein
VDLRGFDPEQPVPPADALAAFLRSLGVDGTDIPVDVAERAAHFRTLVADRRMLILLDNARDADQVRPLLPGGGACLALVTSRDDLAGLVARHGARRIDLDTLTSAEAVALLRTLVGARVDADPAAAVELADRCARLPLALRIAGELALSRRSTPLPELVAQLEDERRRLDLLDATGDRRTAVRTVFSWSHQQLGPAAARAFGLLGLHPGGELDGYTAAALADTSLDDALALLDELARAHLIAPTGARTFGMHNLLRAYAVERATDGDHALNRLLDHYRYAAVAAMDTLFPHERHGRPDLAEPGSPVPPMDQPELAHAWLDLQRGNLVAIAAFAARRGWPRHAVDLSRTLWRHLEVGGHYEQAMALHTSAERAARESGHGHADVLANLGSVHWWLGDFATARGYFERSVTGHRELGDREGQARALARLGLVHERLGDYAEAIRRLEAALASYRELGNRHGEGAQLLNLGAVQRRAGRFEESAAHVRSAAAIFAELGDVRLEGYALGNLGAVLSQLGRHDDALELLVRALRHCRTANDPGGEGSALATIGAIQLRRGRHPEALDHLHRALALSRDTGDRSLETETLNTLGETLAAMDQPETALERHRTALAMAGQAGDRFEQARALAGVGSALAAAGLADDAAEHRRRAHRIYLELDAPEAAAVGALLPDDA